MSLVATLTPHLRLNITLAQARAVSRHGKPLHLCGSLLATVSATTGLRTTLLGRVTCDTGLQGSLLDPAIFAFPASSVDTWIAPTVVLALEYTAEPTAVGTSWVTNAVTPTVDATSVTAGTSSSWMVATPTTSLGAAVATPSTSVTPWTTSVGALVNGVTITPSTIAQAWVLGTNLPTLGGISVAPTAVGSPWSVQAAISVDFINVAPGSAMCAWSTHAPSIQITGVSITPASASNPWTVPTPIATAGPPALFGAHTYWRFKTMNGGSTTGFTAMLFRDSVGNTIATTGGTALESGHTGSNAAANLFDGVDSTEWQSDAVSDAAYCGYVFTTPQIVGQVALQRKASMSGTLPTNGRIEWSDDGITWVDVAWLEVGSLTNDTPKWFDLAPLVRSGATFGAHAYWRLFDPRPVNGEVNSMSALLFKDASGSVLPTTGGSVVGTWGSLANLFDGVDSTSSSTASFSNTAFGWQWAGYHFATPQTVMQMAVQRTATQPRGLPTLAVFQFSDNGEVWGTTCWVNPDNNMTNDVPTWYDFSKASSTAYTNHTHWRAQAINWSDWNALSAMLFKDHNGSFVAATGGSVLEAGEFGSHVGAHAFDGIDSTFWEIPPVNEAWLGYHFPGVVSVQHIALQRTTFDIATSPAAEWFFQYSDDGVIWNTAGSGRPAFVNDVPSWFDLPLTLAPALPATPDQAMSTWTVGAPRAFNIDAAPVAVVAVWGVPALAIVLGDATATPASASAVWAVPGLGEPEPSMRLIGSAWYVDPDGVAISGRPEIESGALYLDTTALAGEAIHVIGDDVYIGDYPTVALKVIRGLWYLDDSNTIAPDASFAFSNGQVVADTATLEGQAAFANPPRVGTDVLVFTNGQWLLDTTNTIEIPSASFVFSNGQLFIDDSTLDGEATVYTGGTLEVGT